MTVKNSELQVRHGQPMNHWSGDSYPYAWFVRRPSMLDFKFHERFFVSCFGFCRSFILNKLTGSAPPALCTEGNFVTR